MPAYYDSIDKGVATVMISYSSWNGKKMHANHELITGFLKGKLQFKVWSQNGNIHAQLFNLHSIKVDMLCIECHEEFTCSYAKITHAIIVLTAIFHMDLLYC